MRDDPEFNPYSARHSVVHNSEEFEIGEGVFLRSEDVWRAAVAANEIWLQIGEVLVGQNSLLDILDQKVISGLVGEIFRAFLAEEASYLFSNPRDDGHPDLCAISNSAIAFLSEYGITLPDVNANLSKAIWTPYGGEENRLPGVEIKATIIGTPVQLKRGPRYLEAKRPSWSAHHQDTPVLLGLVWDYVDSLPTIVGAFFANSLDTSHGKENQHWSHVSTPKDGSKGTSSCSLLLEGCKVMYQNQVLEPVDPQIKHELGMVTKTTSSLSSLSIDQISEIINLHGYQISKNKSKQELIDELLRSRYQTLVDKIRLGDEDFDYSETMIEILGQIGHPDFTPTSNDMKNWFKLKHYFDHGITGIERMRLSGGWILGHNPLSLLQYLRSEMDIE